MSRIKLALLAVLSAAGVLAGTQLATDSFAAKKPVINLPPNPGGDSDDDPDVAPTTTEEDEPDPSESDPDEQAPATTPLADQPPASSPPAGEAETDPAPESTPDPAVGTKPEVEPQPLDSAVPTTPQATTPAVPAAVPTTPAAPAPTTPRATDADSAPSKKPGHHKHHRASEPSSGNDSAAEADDHGTSRRGTATSASASNADAESTSVERTATGKVRVRAGDSLWLIAEDLLGTDNPAKVARLVAELERLNHAVLDQGSDHLEIGAELRVPDYFEGKDLR
jgi:hypothetical protein